MFSQLFMLSSRGGILIFRDYCGELPHNTPEKFQKLLYAMEIPAPYFKIDNIHFFHIKRFGLYFVCVSTEDLEPLLAVEFLNSIVAVCKDYCGELSEVVIEANFPLIYELLDEIIDFGCPHNTSTEFLKDFVFNEPEKPAQQHTTDLTVMGLNLFGVTDRHNISPEASNRSVIEAQHTDSRNEIFIDIVENLVVLISSIGDVIRSEIDGKIVVKNFITGAGEIHITLNHDLTTRESCSLSDVSKTGAIVLDEHTFHESINSSAFENYHKLSFNSMRGEQNIMTYRIADNPLQPLYLHHLFEKVSKTEFKLCLKLTSNMHPTYSARNVKVHLNAPKSTTRMTCEPLGTIEKDLEKGKVEWKVNDIRGGSEKSCCITFVLPVITAVTMKEIGPITLSFEVPSFLCSKICVKNLKVYTQSQSPKQWIRYITSAASYVFRI